MIYCDTSYLVRLYLEDPGWEAVRGLCAMHDVASAAHAQAEIAAALHRACREERLPAAAMADVMEQFETDCAAGAFFWQPLTPVIYAALQRDFRDLPPDRFLRAADALHLACARAHGFASLYSNDKALLAAAPHFGLRGINVIPL